MTFRTLLMSAAFLASTSLPALAHTGGHEADEEKLIPNTCAQLADTQRYTNDVAYPEVKALKARCDSEKASEQSPRQTPVHESH